MINGCHTGSFINQGKENNFDQFINDLTTSKEKSGELCDKNSLC